MSALLTGPDADLLLAAKAMHINLDEHEWLSDQVDEVEGNPSKEAYLLVALKANATVNHNLDAKISVTHALTWDGVRAKALLAERYASGAMGSIERSLLDDILRLTQRAESVTDEAARKQNKSTDAVCTPCGSAAVHSEQGAGREDTKRDSEGTQGSPPTSPQGVSSALLRPLVGRRASSAPHGFVDGTDAGRFESKGDPA